MSDLGFKVRWKVDDTDGAEWTFLRTDTASDAKSLRDEGDLGFWCDLDTEFPGTYHRTGLLAFLPTFLC